MAAASSDFSNQDDFLRAQKRLEDILSRAGKEGLEDSNKVKFYLEPLLFVVSNLKLTKNNLEAIEKEISGVLSAVKKDLKSQESKDKSTLTSLVTELSKIKEELQARIINLKFQSNADLLGSLQGAHKMLQELPLDPKSPLEHQRNPLSYAVNTGRYEKISFDYLEDTMEIVRKHYEAEAKVMEAEAKVMHKRDLESRDAILAHLSNAREKMASLLLMDQINNHYAKYFPEFKESNSFFKFKQAILAFINFRQTYTASHKGKKTHPPVVADICRLGYFVGRQYLKGKYSRNDEHELAIAGFMENMRGGLSNFLELGGKKHGRSYKFWTSDLMDVMDDLIKIQKAHFEAPGPRGPGPGAGPGPRGPGPGAGPGRR